MISLFDIRLSRDAERHLKSFSGSSGECVSLLPLGEFPPSPPPGAMTFVQDSFRRGRGAGGEGAAWELRDRGARSNASPLTPNPSPPAGDVLAKHLPLLAGGEGGLILAKKTATNETRISRMSRFSARNQRIIFDAIEEQLSREPTLVTRNRKPLRENPLANWELRVEKFHVLYDVDEEGETVLVAAVAVKDGNRFIIDGEEHLL